MMIIIIITELPIPDDNHMSEKMVGLIQNQNYLYHQVSSL